MPDIDLDVPIDKEGIIEYIKKTYGETKFSNVNFNTMKVEVL